MMAPWLIYSVIGKEKSDLSYGSKLKEHFVIFNNYSFEFDPVNFTILGQQVSQIEQKN